MRKVPIGITGATGGIGGRIARTLDALNIPTRLIVRDASRAPKLKHSEVVVATYDDAEGMAKAASGVETLFFVSGFESSDRLAQHKTAIDGFTKADIQRVVYTSFVNCAADSTFTFARDHYHTEQYMKAKNLAFAALRDNFYADMVPRLVTDGVIMGPAGNGKFAPVARMDVADVAAALLTDSSQPTGAFDVTGPELVTVKEAANLLTRITGKTVRYHDETLEEAYASREDIDAPEFEKEGWISSYQAIAAGEFEVLSDTVERFTGRAPISLENYLRTSLSTP